MLQGWAKAVQLSERIDAAQAVKEGGEQSTVPQGRRGVDGRSVPSADLSHIRVPLHPGETVPRAQFPAAATLPSWLMDVSSDSEDDCSAPSNPDPLLRVLPLATPQILPPLSGPQRDIAAATTAAVPQLLSSSTSPSTQARDLQGISLGAIQPPCAPIVTVGQSGVVEGLKCGVMDVLVDGVPAMVDPTCSYQVRPHESMIAQQQEEERVAMVRAPVELDFVD